MAAVRNTKTFWGVRGGGSKAEYTTDLVVYSPSSVPVDSALVAILDDDGSFEYLEETDYELGRGDSPVESGTKFYNLKVTPVVRNANPRTVRPLAPTERLLVWRTSASPDITYQDGGADLRVDAIKTMLAGLDGLTQEEKDAVNTIVETEREQGLALLLTRMNAFIRDVQRRLGQSVRVANIESIGENAGGTDEGAGRPLPAIPDGVFVTDDEGRVELAAKGSLTEDVSERIDDLVKTGVALIKGSPERKFGPYIVTLSHSPDISPSTTARTFTLVPTRTAGPIILNRLFHEFWDGELRLTFANGGPQGGALSVDRGFTHTIGGKSFTVWRSHVEGNIRRGDVRSIPLKVFDSHSVVTPGADGTLSVPVDVNGNVVRRILNDGTQNPEFDDFLDFSAEELAAGSEFSVTLRLAWLAGDTNTPVLTSAVTNNASLVFFQLEDGVRSADEGEIKDLDGRIDANAVAIARETANRMEEIRDITSKLPDGTVNLEPLTERVEAVETQLGADENTSESVEAAIERLDTDKASQTDLEAEKTARIAADALKAAASALEAEVTARTDSDTGLNAKITAIETQLGADENTSETVEAAIKRIDGELDNLPEGGGGTGEDGAWARLYFAQIDDSGGFVRISDADAIYNPSGSISVVAKIQVGTADVTDVAFTPGYPVNPTHNVYAIVALIPPDASNDATVEVTAIYRPRGDKGEPGSGGGGSSYDDTAVRALITANANKNTSQDTAIAANTTARTNNATAIQNNANNIQANTQAHNALDTRVTSNTSEIQGTKRRVTAVETQQNTNTNKIASEGNRITANTNNITAVTNQLGDPDTDDKDDDTTEGRIKDLQDQIDDIDTSGGDADLTETVQNVETLPDPADHEEGEAFRERSSGDIADVVDAGNRDFPFTMTGEEIDLHADHGKALVFSQVTTRNGITVAGRAIHVPNRRGGGPSVGFIAFFRLGNIFRISIGRFPYVTVRNRVITPTDGSGAFVDSSLETGVDALTAVIKATIEEAATEMFQETSFQTVRDTDYTPNISGVQTFLVGLTDRDNLSLFSVASSIVTAHADGMGVITYSDTSAATRQDNASVGIYSLDGNNIATEVARRDGISFARGGSYSVSVEFAMVQGVRYVFDAMPGSAAIVGFSMTGTVRSTKTATFADLRYDGIGTEYHAPYPGGAEEMTTYSDTIVDDGSDPNLEIFKEIISEGVEFDTNLFVGGEAADSTTSAGKASVAGGNDPLLINNSAQRYFPLDDYEGTNFSIKDGYIVSDKDTSVNLAIDSDTSLTFAALAEVDSRAVQFTGLQTISLDTGDGTATVNLAAGKTYVIYTLNIATANITLSAGSGKQLFNFTGAQVKNFQIKDTFKTRENTQKIGQLTTEMDHISEAVASLRSSPGLFGDGRSVDTIGGSDIVSATQLPAPAGSSPGRVRLVEGYHQGEHIGTALYSRDDAGLTVGNGATPSVANIGYTLDSRTVEAYSINTSSPPSIVLRDSVPHTRVILRGMLGRTADNSRESSFGVKVTLYLNGDAHRERTFMTNTAVHEVGDSVGTDELIRGDIAMGVFTDLDVGDIIHVGVEVTDAPSENSILVYGALELIGSNTVSLLGINEIPEFSTDHTQPSPDFARVSTIDHITAAIGSRDYSVLKLIDVVTTHTINIHRDLLDSEAYIITAPDTPMEMTLDIADLVRSANANITVGVYSLNDANDTASRVTDRANIQKRNTPTPVTMTWTTVPGGRYIVVVIPQRGQDVGRITGATGVRLRGVYNEYPFLGAQEHNYDNASKSGFSASSGSGTVQSFALNNAALGGSPRYFNFVRRNSFSGWEGFEAIADCFVHVQLGNIRTSSATTIKFVILETGSNLGTGTAIVAEKDVALTTDNDTDSFLEFTAEKDKRYTVGAIDDGNIVSAVGNIKITARNPQFPDGYTPGLLRPNNQRQPADLYKLVRLRAKNTMTATYGSTTANGRKYSGFSIGHLVGNSYPDTGKVTTMWGPGGAITHVDFIDNTETRVAFIGVDINMLNDMKHDLNTKAFFDAGGDIDNDATKDGIINPRRYDAVHAITPEFRAQDTARDGSVNPGGLAYVSVAQTTTVAGTTIKWFESLPAPNVRLEQFDGKVTDFLFTMKDNHAQGLWPYDYAYVPTSAYDTDTAHHMTVQLAHIAQLLQQYKGKINEIANTINGVDPLS